MSLPHEGAKVTKGQKYMLRTDVVYEKVMQEVVDDSDGEGQAFWNEIVLEYDGESEEE